MLFLRNGAVILSCLLIVSPAVAGDHGRLLHRRVCNQSQSTECCHTIAVHPICPSVPVESSVMNSTLNCQLIQQVPIACDCGTTQVSNDVATEQLGEPVPEVTHQNEPPLSKERKPLTPEEQESEEKRRELEKDKGVQNLKPKMRQWSDSTEIYHAIAHLQRVEGSAVVLLKENGKLIQVPISRLSKADQSYIQSLPHTKTTLVTATSEIND